MNAHTGEAMSGSPAVTASSTTVDEPPEQRRTLAVLLLAQILSGAGLAAGITVGALLAEQMLGSSRLSGLPTVFFTIGRLLRPSAWVDLASVTAGARV